MKKAASIIIGVLVLILASGFFIETKTTGIVPLYDKYIAQKTPKPYYVKINSTPKEIGSDKYKYTFKGYDENGNEQEIIKVVDRKLRTDAYLRISAYEKYGEAWIEVQPDEVPTKALDKLQ